MRHLHAPHVHAPHLHAPHLRVSDDAPPIVAIVGTVIGLIVIATVLIVVCFVAADWAAGQAY